MLSQEQLEPWLSFYAPYTPSRAQALKFVMRCESESPQGHRARIMMHQTQRLVSLADDVLRIRPGCDALSVLFLFTCAEHIAKLHSGFNEEGRSKEFVLKFFQTFLTAEDKSVMSQGVRDRSTRPMDLDAAVTKLYAVRCSVVHEGDFWDFRFGNQEASMLNVDHEFICALSMTELRGIIVRGCMKAALSVS